jgi:hypothetical protein
MSVFLVSAPFLEKTFAKLRSVAGQQRLASMADVRPRPPRRAKCEDFVQLCISCFAFSGVIAVVGTVTTVGTFSAQSSRIDFAISIASGPPVG